MKRLKFGFMAICLWLFFLYNIERLGQPINIASFVYVLTIVCTLLLFLVAPLRRIPSLWFFVGVLPLFFFLKYYLGYPIGGEHLPITITEISAIAVTTILAGQVGWNLEDWGKAFTTLITGHLKQGSPFVIGQSQLYREIRRARIYKRPATLLAISATHESLQGSVERFMAEVEHEIIHKYIDMRIADLLIKELKDCDIVAQRDDHFIVLLPETSYDSVAEITRKLQTAAYEKLRLKFKIGISTFPDEAVTLERLLEEAEIKMKSAEFAGDNPPIYHAELTPVLEAQSNGKTIL